MQAIVIGGGISGLTCAFRLRELGVSVTLLEASDRFGGVIQSIEKDGFLFECGPQSFLATAPLLDLIRRLGLEGELQLADPRAPRYILFRGKLVPAPLSPSSLLKTPLLGAWTKFRILAEPGRRSRPPESDESIADFVRRKFGSQLLDRLVAPFVSGVYAGDPEQLSLRSAFPALFALEKKHGSVLRGAIKSRQEKKETAGLGLASFRTGAAALVHTLGERLGGAAQSGASVSSLSRKKSNGKTGFIVEIVRGGKTDRLEAGAVIVATPTRAAASLLVDISPPLTARLQQIPYAPVAVVGLGYRSEQVHHTIGGFGFLVPRSQGLRILGNVWNSSLFAGRAPEGHCLLTSFVGGATDPLAIKLSDDALSAIVEQELAEVLQISGAPVTRLIRRYERAIPQYNLGHGEIVTAMREEQARHLGLFLVGNYLQGPSIGSCVEQASRTAEEAHEYIFSMSRSPADSLQH